MPKLTAHVVDLIITLNAKRAPREDSPEPPPAKPARRKRKGLFKPEIKVADGASPQERLLAYTGRAS